MNSFKAALTGIYPQMVDEFARSLNGMSREAWDAAKRRDREFWAAHPGAKAACTALDDHWRTQRRRRWVALARAETGVSRLVLLQMASEDHEDHAPGDDEWVRTVLSLEWLRTLASDVYPYRFRSYDTRKTFSEWLCSQGLAVMVTDAPEHLEY